MKTIDYISPCLTIFTMVTENTIMTGSSSNGLVAPQVDALERDENALNF